MLAPRRLHSINLLSLLSKCGSIGPTLFLYPERAASSSTTRQLMMGDSAAEQSPTNRSSGDNGRVWLHRQFQIIPTQPLQEPPISSDQKSTITNCPLPKSTPPTTLENKMHYLHSSSSTPEKILAQLHQSKVEFYKSHFQTRTSEEERKRIDRRTIQSPLGEVDVTIYHPKNNKNVHENNGKESSPKLHGVCLFVHGGGWLWGDSMNQAAHRCLEMAEALDVTVVSVEYSLFCQVNRHSNGFDPVNDVLIAIDWIEANGATEFNARPAFVASGESSGAHLLLLAMLKRRDRDNAVLRSPLSFPPPSSTRTTQSTSPLSNWKCLNLVYGVYDISGTPSVHADGDSSSPLCGNDLLWLYDLYYSTVQKHSNGGDNKQQSHIDRKHPSLSPLYQNLSHLPPALLSVGTADPLIDDTLFMANKLSVYRNQVELAIYEGGEHGIGHFGLQEEEIMGVRARTHSLEYMKFHLGHTEF